METNNDVMDRIKQIDREEFEAIAKDKDKAAQIDSDEFKAAVQQLKLGNMYPANELMQIMGNQDNSDKLNVARMAYFNAYVLINPDMFNAGKYEANRFEVASRVLLVALGRLIGIEIEKKP